MTFERTADQWLVREVMTHPEIYPYLGDDSRPSADKFTPYFDKSLLYVTVKEDNSDLIGMFLLVKHTSIKWEAHTMMLPRGRGRRAVKAYKQGIEWCRDNGCLYLEGLIPEDNEGAIAVALLGGMEHIGTLRKSILRGGKLLDEVIVGKSLNG